LAISSDTLKKRETEGRCGGKEREREERGGEEMDQRQGQGKCERAQQTERAFAGVTSSNRTAPLG
jgi:hypothetical protein